ncbi:MAG: polysulfide reductase NrfD [Thermodesulfobacteriaceae bacterium]|nr:polysulfide reductase NrfD [Thermodesulfobacteriaceae bacterium]MCX8042188.1 polysulfide reductase NrfD [Thermodesulfobacteriaceae bacterium]MDW8135673.1 NrfD/PsrC family molybdoenzyme membrane anchor subunit [Thermodesulfobacterium sp.]
MNLGKYLPGTKASRFLLGLTFLVFLISMAFGIHAMHIGYRHAYGVTREIPWGVLISGYVFFVVTSTGLCIVSSIGHVFGVKSFIPIAKRAVYLSIITLLAGFMVIFFDLENPFRMLIWNLFSPNLTSNIWWMGTLYGVYLFFMSLEFFFLLVEKHRSATIAGLLGLISGVAAHSNLGAVFGMLHGREFWYGPYMPIYFIASAAASGCTAIIFFTYLGYKLMNEKMERAMEISLQAVGKVWALVLAILMFFTTWKLITAFVGGEGKILAVKELISGKYAFNFWFFEVFLGMILPFIILLVSRFQNLTHMFIASLLAFIGIYFMRVDLVVLGQVVSHYFELSITDFPTFLSYTPTIYENMIIIGAIAFTILTFLIGEGVFKGHKVEIH